jgi:predicted RNase H-like HicB family nuclease
MAHYTVLIEHPSAPGESWGAYCPDLPGCVAVGETEEDVLSRMARALEMHLAGMIEDGDAIPAPSTHAVTMVVSVPEPLSRAA